MHSRYRTDPGVLALEGERIFSRTWQVVAHESDVPPPGLAWLADRVRADLDELSPTQIKE